MRIIPLISTLVALAGCYTTLALECKSIEIEGKRYDLSPLNKDFNISSSEETYPTVTQTTYLINPCAPLQVKKEEEADRCSKNTQICRLITNFKNNEPRIIRINSLAGGANETEPTLSLKTSENAQQDTLIWSLSGMDKQKAEITFTCDKDGNKDSEPTIKSYENNLLSLEWKSPFACSNAEPEKDKPVEDKPDESSQSRSGWSIFFIVVFCLLFLYFAAGIIYNYLVNHETGIYLIPHLHFWRSFSEVIKDLGYQLYNKCMGVGRGQHGYSTL
ncbi:hypothetical protein K493DRAFT_411470 [Basidiobolus meristosporus CBS 931.73]|uniref:Autophagy-related protein 27 n=1 Tax=Basidiobolus meristosporus CBS 931.73 TaxID=1314790 RepID=A0A1Y1XHQ3_9FUNG|nr:hypothetical protein K493DRAFT_411470 [Basidiobolus meristosporus CBS 931.73]|eukprot:ORX85291.1 hypothetical protein K493DRAFT_411470 [Basidiobolus meristosporus CBS 931.73]